MEHEEFAGLVCPKCGVALVSEKKDHDCFRRYAVEEKT